MVPSKSKLNLADMTRVSGELYWFRLVLDVGKFFMTAK